jgi:hypothetical protein
MKETFIPLVYRDARKAIWNKIERFQAESLVDELLLRLHKFDPSDIQTIRAAPPWRLLLLLKWTFGRGRFGQGCLPRINPLQMNRLINETSAIEDCLTLPSQHRDVQLFLRRMAYQQFWFQDRTQKAHIARQSLLFRDLPATHPLALNFASLTDVPLQTFLAVSFLLMMGFVGRTQPSTPRRYFASLEAQFSAPVINRALEAISRTPEEVGQLICERQLPSNFEHLEYYERTPLTRSPLLRVGETYIHYGMPVLVRGFETLVYDTLRHDDASRLMNEFGPLFESYVRRGIQELAVPFLDERELRARYGSGKVVDFALQSQEGTVFVDAKGVEIQALAMTTSNPEFLTRQVQTSVLKGLSQAVELQSRMGLSEPPYVLLVTYKHLLLGNGSDFMRYADPKEVANKSGDVSALDMKRVYFVSIEEFDYLVAALAKRGMHLAAFLAEVEQADTRPETKCLMMMQHINNRLRPYGLPSYLENEFEDLMDIAKVAFQANEPPTPRA